MPESIHEEESVEGVPVVGTLGDVLAGSNHGIGTLLLEDTAALAAMLRVLQHHFEQIVVIRQHSDTPVERVRAFNLGGVLAIEFTNKLLLWPNRLTKRIVDLCLASALLLVCSPIIVLAAVCVKLSDGGPAFYGQTREGHHGSSFKVWKLRTMYADAETRLQHLLETDQAVRKEWNDRLKLTRDPRIISGIGKFLRQSSIDELPQLWNVIIGDMSLVGPRPLPEYHITRFGAEFRELRRRVRPGVTGMWQVTTRSDGGLEDQELYDSYYIRNWSIWLDLYLIARTGIVVMRGRGAY
jgi:lipopolysaccharide/colanic/teichoic acid biosynthesis glycosyltransferase